MLYRQQLDSEKELWKNPSVRRKRKRRRRSGKRSIIRTKDENKALYRKVVENNSKSNKLSIRNRKYLKVCLARRQNKIRKK